MLYYKRRKLPRRCGVILDKRLKIPFNAPLHENDTDSTTYGCRQNNPDICNSNSLDRICAFTSDDSICKKPSKAWKKQYQELIKGKTFNEN